MIISFYFIVQLIDLLLIATGLSSTPNSIPPSIGPVPPLPTAPDGRHTMKDEVVQVGCSVFLMGSQDDRGTVRGLHVLQWAVVT